MSGNRDSYKNFPKQASFEDRLMRMVEYDTNGGCWIWSGNWTRGYGSITKDGRQKSTHRASYEFYKGPIPSGLHILHSCDVRACVNPNHLRAGTQSENIMEAYDRNRIPPNHLRVLTEDQVREIKKLLPTSSVRSIASKYKVAMTTIANIKVGRTWRRIN